MKIHAWQCVCPICHHQFVAYLSDAWTPSPDEDSPGRRRLLCNVCDRAFLNTLFAVFGDEVRRHGPISFSELCLSAMQQEARRAGEPGPEAQAGTGEARRVSDGVQGVSHKPRDAAFQDRVSGPLGTSPETLRGETVLPSKRPE